MQVSECGDIGLSIKALTYHFMAFKGGIYERQEKKSYLTIRFEGHEAGWAYDFSESLTAQEYAKRQGVIPVADTSMLYGDFLPEDWEGFDEALES